MNDQLSNKILEQIEEKNIIPLPRWRFILLRISFWVIAVFSLIVGSFAVGAILFIFVDFHKHGLFSTPNSVTDFLLMIPSLWMIVFILFILITKVSIKHTKRGYKYSLYKVVTISILLSVIFGSVLSILGVGKITHELLNNNINIYNRAVYNSKDAWDRPVSGRIAGVVVLIQDNNNFSILDFNRRLWQVSFEKSVKSSFVPEMNSTVRISGFIDQSSGIFIAHSVHEWEE